jgi:acyl carrier protein phosphodiesterase
MLPYMIKHNWLLNYGKIEGISRALRGISERSTMNIQMHHSIQQLQDNMKFIQDDFNVFFPELIDYVGYLRK